MDRPVGSFGKMAGITREVLQKELEKDNIESRPLWKPMHLQPVFSSCPAYLNGTSEDPFTKGLCLPSGSNMTDADRERIMKVLKKCLNI
jgi:dTDP-4-amino-4,6-dideoxygalactose transaminase